MEREQLTTSQRRSSHDNEGGALLNQRHLGGQFKAQQQLLGLSTDLINPDEEEELNGGQVNSHFPVIAGGKRPHPLTATHKH